MPLSYENRVRAICLHEAGYFKHRGMDEMFEGYDT